MATLGPGPIAFFPWGDVIEEFLDPLGLTAEDYAARMRGGWLFGFIAALQRQGRDSIIVYGSERVPAPRRLLHAETGAPIWLVPARRSGGGRTRERPSARAVLQWSRTPLRGFAKVLRQERASAVLVQDYEHPRFEALVLLARGLGRPVFATFQGGDVTLSPLEARVRPRALRACQAVIAPSARERARLTAQHGLAPGRILDIPNPVDEVFWQAEPQAQARATLGLPHDAFLVMNHGRIDLHRKGLDVLVEAWRRLAAQRPTAELLILGSGQDREGFAALSATAPRIRWLDRYITDPPQVRRWLSAADAYVTLSRVEGMPVAPLEAMACGLPVVASDAHGLADIFRDGETAGGLLTRTGEPGAAADALVRLADDPALRRRLGLAARRAITARYGLDPVGEALAQALDQGADRPRPALHPNPVAAGL